MENRSSASLPWMPVQATALRNAQLRMSLHPKPVINRRDQSEQDKMTGAGSPHNRDKSQYFCAIASSNRETDWRRCDCRWYV